VSPSIPHFHFLIFPLISFDLIRFKTIRLGLI
jgi:hypothetical protein